MYNDADRPDPTTPHRLRRIAPAGHWMDTARRVAAPTYRPAACYCYCQRPLQPNVVKELGPGIREKKRTKLLHVVNSPPKKKYGRLSQHILTQIRVLPCLVQCEACGFVLVGEESL